MFRLDRGTGSERFSTLPQYSLEVGGINGPRLKNELSKGDVYVTPWAGELLDSLQRLGGSEPVSVVKFQLRDVGIRNHVSGMKGWDTLVKAVRKEGLELCPQLTAPEMAQLDADIIREGEYVDILSQLITDRSGDRNVFALNRNGGKLKLNGNWTDYGWDPDELVVARLR